MMEVGIPIHPEEVSRKPHSLDRGVMLIRELAVS
jgi:hypothetical protein